MKDATEREMEKNNKKCMHEFEHLNPTERLRELDRLEEREISKNRDCATERKVKDIVENGKDGIDYEFNSIGKQDVDVSKIDSPNIDPEDFKKHSMKEMEEYISQGRLEREIQIPKLTKFGDRYYVNDGGRHRVFIAKYLALDKIPAHVDELKILK